MWNTGITDGSEVFNVFFAGEFDYFEHITYWAVKQTRGYQK